MKRIVLTGGGTAGHVTPNMALIPSLQQEGYEVHYIGSYDGIERKLIEEMGIPYYGISSGKLRRYFDPKNFSDPFKVIKGYREAKSLLKKIKPDVLFSKGGFVTVPVVLAAKSVKIPSIIHESDMTPGLANKICIPSAKKVCANFPETIKYLPEGKAILTGTPIRKELFEGNAIKGLDFLHFTANKPVLLVMGGSTGSVIINEAVRGVLKSLLETYQIVHLCGKGKVDEAYQNIPGYVQFEYMKENLKDVFACSNVIISRAGANSICELLLLRKPHILIPLSASSSRGDQILNAESFEKQGYSYVIKEETLTDITLLSGIHSVYENRAQYIEAMKQSTLNNAVETIVKLINEIANKK